jgi:hypothetical protein
MDGCGFGVGKRGYSGREKVRTGSSAIDMAGKVLRALVAHSLTTVRVHSYTALNRSISWAQSNFLPVLVSSTLARFTSPPAESPSTPTRSPRTPHQPVFKNSATMYERQSTSLLCRP